MKIGIVIGIIIGAIISGAAIFAIAVFGLLPLVRETGNNQTDSTQTPVTYPTTTNTIPPATFPPPVNTPIPSQIGTPNTPDTDVNFRLNVTNTSISGITGALVTAQLTNTGNSDAHNTYADVEVYVQGIPTKVNGQESLRVDLGTIKAGQTVTRDVEMSFGLFDGIKISQSGATLNLIIRADEKTQSLTYFYQP